MHPAIPATDITPRDLDQDSGEEQPPFFSPKHRYYQDPKPRPHPAQTPPPTWKSPLHELQSAMNEISNLVVSGPGSLTDWDRYNSVAARNKHIWSLEIPLDILEFPEAKHEHRLLRGCLHSWNSL